MKKFWLNLRMFLWLTFLTGIIYPLLITAIAQLTMKGKADGDFVVSNEKVVGAKLIGQKFESEKYFWSRPSATDYQTMPSGGSNLSPTSKALKNAVHARMEQIKSKHPNSNLLVPAELLFASGSGLDPHLSVQGAKFQIDRIAQARNRDRKEIESIIDRLVIHRWFGIGQKTVNVLQLNLALDEIAQN